MNERQELEVLLENVAKRTADDLRVLFRKEGAKRMIDPMTRVQTRAGLNDLGSIAIEKAIKYGRGITYFAVDNNDFNEVNDLRGYRGVKGHPGGDLLIQDTSRILLCSVRPEDIVARVGGDEWSILFYDIQPEDALSVATRLSDRFHRITDETISIGITTYNVAPKEITLETLAKEADSALYEAKKLKASGKTIAVYKPKVTV